MVSNAGAIPAGTPDASPANVFIVGAGFSLGAGLPLATAFTQALLNVDHMKKGVPSRGLVALMRHFVNVAFHHGSGTEAKYWPDLEDLFTTIDLSANTGHHLGKDYSPATLRTVRRALLVRMIRMLTQAYKVAKRRRDEGWKDLDEFFKRVDPKDSAFLSLNWDSVIEQGLADAHGITSYDYGCGAHAARFETDELSVGEPTGPTATILKPHGSINWLYCDACRHLLWVPPSQTLKVADQLFRPRDWRMVKELTGLASSAAASLACPTCGADALGTRFATFSYRKALDFPMHSRTWQRAEELLYQAENWVFIGYSLPPADYEFKYLLKRVELSRPTPPKIVLVTGGDAAESTRANYQRFFGPSLRRRRGRVFFDGLNRSALEGLAKLGCISKTKPPRVGKS